jgi:hypothetical protein
MITKETKREISEIKKLLSEDKRNTILSFLEKLMIKYDKLEVNAETRKQLNSASYYAGVSDGINNCYKAISGIVDDYLDEI